MKKKYKKCFACGERKANVKRVQDPYEAEINEKTVWKNLCEECYENIAAEI